MIMIRSRLMRDFFCPFIFLKIEKVLYVIVFILLVYNSVKESLY